MKTLLYMQTHVWSSPTTGQTRADTAQPGCFWKLFRLAMTKNNAFLRRHATAQTFVIYCHLVSLGCPSRTLRRDYVLGMHNCGECLEKLVWFDFSWHLNTFKRGWSAYRREVENPEKSKRTDCCQEGRRGCEWTDWRDEERDESKSRSLDTETEDETKKSGKCKGTLKEHFTRMQQPCLSSLFNYVPPTLSWNDSLRQWGKTDAVLENNYEYKLL